MILIWDMGIGGMQKRVRDLVLDISKRHPEWEIHLVVKFEKPSHFTDDIRTKSQVKIYYYSNSYKESRSVPSVFWIAKRYLSIKPDICLTFLDYLSIITLSLKSIIFWRNTKLVLNEGVFTSKYLIIYRKRLWLWKSLVKVMYPLADLIVVPTHACKIDLAQSFGIRYDLIKVIPNWTLYPARSQMKKKYEMIFVGRLEKEKNLDMLISLSSRLRSDNVVFRLCIVGDGRLRHHIEAKITQLGLEDEVDIVGTTEHVEKFLLKSKVLVLSTMNEGMPNVVLEAGMCQVPAIVNRFEGCEEVVQHNKTGYIASSLEQMVIQVKKLLENDSLREKLGRQAQKFVRENFSRKNQELFIHNLLS